MTTPHIPDEAENLRFGFFSEDGPNEAHFNFSVQVQGWNHGVQEKGKLMELLVDAVEQYRQHVNSLNPTYSFASPTSPIVVRWEEANQRDFTP